MVGLFFLGSVVSGETQNKLYGGTMSSQGSIIKVNLDTFQVEESGFREPESKDYHVGTSPSGIVYEEEDKVEPQEQTSESDIMECPECGSQLEESARFCDECGAYLH